MLSDHWWEIEGDERGNAMRKAAVAAVACGEHDPVDLLRSVVLQFEPDLAEVFDELENEAASGASDSSAGGPDRR